MVLLPGLWPETSQINPRRNLQRRYDILPSLQMGRGDEYSRQERGLNNGEYQEDRGEARHSV